MGTSQSNDSLSSQEKFKLFLENERLINMFPLPTAELIKIKSRKPIKPRPQNGQKTTLIAQPNRGKNESVVSAGEDQRVQILRTAQWPNSVHGVVSSKFRDHIVWGTGILIGPNIVLTAGHNLYSHDSQIFAELSSLQFLPGVNGALLPFGFVEVEKYFVSPAYVEDSREDYAILILKKPIGEITGYFGLACLGSEELKQKRINITGYPGDKVASKPGIYEMWGMEGSASYVDRDQSEIQYLIDTDVGQSGSGIWYQEGDEYYVCGVHVRGDTSVNQGTLLTREIYQQIHDWIQKAVVKDSLLMLGDRKRLEFSDYQIDTECLSLLLKYNLDDLQTLDLFNREIGEEGVKVLAKNTSWKQLLELDLSQNNIGIEGSKSLARNSSWSSLSKLDLSRNNIDSEGIQALAKNAYWINLQELKLSENNIGIEGIKALAKSVFWRKLSKLDLSRNNIDAEGARELSQNTFWIDLSSLNLSENNIGPEGVKALARNSSWIYLSELDLSGNNIGAEGASALAHNTTWSKITKLILWQNDVASEGAKALAENTCWEELRELSLWRNRIGPEGAQALAENMTWKKLSKLDLNGNFIDALGAQLLALNNSWTRLSELTLVGNDIGTIGAQGLAKNTSWNNLRKLDLSMNYIGPQGAKALAKNTSWARLFELNMFGNNIGDEGMKALSQNCHWDLLSQSNIFI